MRWLVSGQRRYRCCRVFSSLIGAPQTSGVGLRGGVTSEIPFGAAETESFRQMIWDGILSLHCSLAKQALG